MIRHRRQLIFDWAHALWMGAALMLLWANWISLWDLHSMRSLTLPTVATGFLYSMLLYSVCALVSPKLDGEDGMLLTDEYSFLLWQCGSPLFAGIPTQIAP